jgi:hypothetical protein
VNSEWSCSAAWRRHIARHAGNLGGLLTQPFFIINKISMTAPILSALGNKLSRRFTPPAITAAATPARRKFTIFEQEGMHRGDGIDYYCSRFVN